MRLLLGRILLLLELLLSSSSSSSLDRLVVGCVYGIAVGTKNLEDDGDRDRLGTSLSSLSLLSPLDMYSLGAGTLVLLPPFCETLGAAVVELSSM